MKNHIYFLAMLILLVIRPLSAGGQIIKEEYERTISVSEWIDEMKATDGGSYEIKNTKIEWQFDDKNKTGKDLRYLEDVVRNGKKVGRRLLIRDLDLRHLDEMKARNCIFPVLLFYNANLPSFRFRYSELEQIELKHCTIEKLTISHSTFEELTLSNSIVEKNIRFSKCTALERGRVGLTETKFTDTMRSHVKSYDNYHLMFYSSSVDKIEIKNCDFALQYNETIEFDNINLFGSQVNYLWLKETDFTSLEFQNLSINKAFEVKDINISTYLKLKSFDYPQENTNVNWKYISGGKICFWLNDSTNYFGKSDSEISLDYEYNELIAIYNKLLLMYKVRGDRLAANGCYVQIKEIETRRFNYIYRTTPSVKAWFDWRLNQFLKYFCDYGTSPVKSLIISMYVIAAFAFLYFFFYSDWDRINRTFLMKQYRKMLQYFRSEQKLEDFYSNEHREKFQSYEEFKAEIEESKVEIPYFFGLLGKPLYRMSLINYKVMTWFYRRTEILSGRWVDLQPVRKIGVSLTVGLAIMFYLLYLVFVRALNSIVLSINTFSTLGFGDIPVKGFTRYVAILEGFLGWFLLSIFSVSLIGQILQT